MLKRICITCLALGITLLLLSAAPRMLGQKEPSAAPLPMTRVWIAEQDGRVSAWLKQRARAYEKETGARVYLRLAVPGEAASPHAIPPDLLIGGSGTPVALRGYALILRADDVPAETPLPTSLLFVPPSPAPGPSPTPAPAPDVAALKAVLSPPALADSLPGTVASADPLADFCQGKARCALLTAAQVRQLPFGYQAYPIPEGKGFLPVGAQARTEDGERFLAFLAHEASQQALREFGLYACSLRLYGPDDPLRQLIDGSRAE